MRSSLSRRLAALATGLALTGALCAPYAFGQPAGSAAAPRAPASAAASATPTASAAAPAGSGAAPTASAPSAAASASPSASAPASTSAAPSAPAAPPAPPPGHGSDPHGGQRPQLPKDGTARDPSVPVGTLAIALRDAFEAPVEGFELEVEIVHMTIATGESRESLKVTTDAEGNAYVRDLKVGSGHSYSVRARYKGSVFSVKDVRLDDRTGAMVLLHVFEPTTDFMEAKTVGMNEITISQKEDFLVIGYAILYENPGPYALQVNHEITLPPGFTALQSDDKQVPKVTPTDLGGRVEGTMRPGRHVIQFSFQIPLEEDGEQAFSVPMMPNIWTSEIRVTALKDMGLEVAGYGATSRTYDGQASWLETSRELTSLREGFIQRADIKLTGMPTRPMGAYVALVLGLIAAIVGGAYAVRRRASPALASDTIEDLLEAQQTLLDEFVALERARQRGDIGPKSYARIRQAMLDALARIVVRLENAGGPQAALPATSSPTQAGKSNAEKVRSDRDKSGPARVR